MAKIVFLQKNSFDLHGLMYISGLLKQHGHEVRLLIVPEEKKLWSMLQEFSPDFVGFSIISSERLWALDLAARVKEKLSAITVFGGIDPTICPEIIENDQVDIICRGEGEFAMLEMLDSFDSSGAVLESIENLCLKSRGRVIENPIRPLIQDLDQLPLIDRGLYYDRYKFLSTYPIKRFMIGRGCPFNCSYCCNNALRKLYKGKGKYVRRHGVERVIREIDIARKKYALRMIDFIDDDFISDKPWLLSFLKEYKKNINLPYSCLVRIDLVDEEIVSVLKDSGCVTVSFGIESGDEDVRNGILNKRLKNEEIIRGASLLKKYKLKFNSYNILNIPGESIESGFKTVNLNVKIQTDYPWCSIFQPFPGTEFWDTLNSGKDSEEKSDLNNLNFYSSSLISQKDSGKLMNLEKFFYYAVKFPFLQPLIKRLITLPANRIFQYFFLLSFAYRHSQANRLSIWEEFVYNARHISTYFRKPK